MEKNKTEYKDLTQEEIDALRWTPYEKYALVNKETKAIFVGADDAQWVREQLVLITEKHPLYHKMQFVERSQLPNQ
jgi:hypothetical protein